MKDIHNLDDDQTILNLGRAFVILLGVLIVLNIVQIALLINVKVNVNKLSESYSTIKIEETTPETEEVNETTECTTAPVETSIPETEETIPETTENKAIENTPSQAPSSSVSGELNISNVQTKDLDLEVGAGNVIISNLLVENKADIDGGAGKVVIKDSNLSDLDLDVGVGEFQILNSKLLDNSDIDAGIGKLEISLKGDLEDYRIIPTRGLGSFTIEDNEIENDRIYGNGDNKIKIDAGIGKIDIDFIKEDNII